MSTLGEPDRRRQLHREIADRGITVWWLHRQIAEHDRRIVWLHAAVKDRDRRIAELQQAPAGAEATTPETLPPLPSAGPAHDVERGRGPGPGRVRHQQDFATAAILERELARRDGLIAVLDEELARRRATAARLEGEVSRRDEVIAALERYRPA